MFNEGLEILKELTNFWNSYSHITVCKKHALEVDYPNSQVTVLFDLLYVLSRIIKHH